MLTIISKYKDSVPLYFKIFIHFCIELCINISLVSLKLRKIFVLKHDFGKICLEKEFRGNARPSLAKKMRNPYKILFS